MRWVLSALVSVAMKFVMIEVMCWFIPDREVGLVLGLIVG